MRSKKNKLYKKRTRKQVGANKKIKGYVINLDERKEKWDKIKNEFKDTNIELERFPAIKHNDGHIGCGLSHVELVKKAKRENSDSILIIEDDCKLTKNFNERWNLILDYLNKHKDEWDIFNGGVVYPADASPIIDIGDDIKLIRSNGEGCRYANFVYVNKSGYDKIIEWENIAKESEKSGTPLIDPKYDAWINHYPRFRNIVMEVGPIVIQSSGFSNTDKTYKNLNLYSSDRNKEIKEKDITIGILNWKACSTLMNTLNSYKKNSLLDIVKPIIFFQEMDDVQKKIAEKFNIRYIGDKKNIGIQQALKKLIESTDTKYYISAEDDFELIYDKETITKVFKDSIDLLENHNVNVVKLTDIKNFGHDTTRQIYENEFKDKEDKSNFVWKLEALSYVDKPEEVFPNVFRIVDLNYKWYICDTKNNKWSNHIYIAKTDFLKKIIIPIIDNNISNINAYMNFEIAMDKYLENHSFNIARGMGLFKHNRIYKGSENCKLELIGGGTTNISYFTVSTKRTPELQRLEYSAKKYDWSIDILGLEENTVNLGWEDKNNKSGNYGNFSIKLIKEREYCSNKNYDDIVLFTDAWDVVALGDSTTLYERFKKFNKDLVFGAEKACSPDDDKKDMYKTQNVPFPYLNSGFFIGKAGVIKKYLDEYNNEKINDQKFWTGIYLKNQENIALDSNAELVLQTWDTDDKYYNFDNNKFTYTETNTNPLFIHANGHIKDKLALFETNFNLFISTAYVINLENRKEKWERIENDFKQSSIYLERFNAITHENGATGLTKSIKEIIKIAKDKNLQSILIFEDDNKPLEKFNERWIIIKKWLDKNIDDISNNQWDIFNGGFRLGGGGTIDIVDKLDNDVTLLRCSHFIALNWIYINKRIYDAIINFDEHEPIDAYLGRQDTFKNICSYPLLGTQYNGFSNTTKEERNIETWDKENNEIIENLLKEKQKGGSKQDAYVINLEERENKWLQIQEDFKDTNFNLIRFNAIKDENGHKGCGKSYQALIQMAKEKNMDYIYIFDDDCKPLDNFNERWIKIKKWLDANNDKWEIFNGGLKTVHGSETNLIDTIDENNKIYSIHKGINTHMLLYKKEVYDRMLEWDYDKNWLIDYNYINTNKFKTVYVDPALTVQRNGFSNTEKINKENQLGGKKRRTRKRLTKKKKKQNGGGETIHYITVSTKDTPELQRLVKSAKKYGWNLEVLGLDLDTTNLGHSKGGKFGMKLKYPKEYIKTKNDNDIILFSDAWDVMVVGTPEQLINKYKSFNKDIVFSAENACWPDGSREPEYVDTKNEAFPYLNSGGYVGKVSTLKEIFNNYNDGDEIDDQRFWTDMYFKNRDKIVLDTKAEIFLSMHDVKEEDLLFDNNIFTYKETNTNPILVHGNGTSKSLLDIFVSKIQYGGNNRKKITWILHYYVPYMMAGCELAAHNINKYLISKGYIINVIGNWDNKIIDGIQYINENDIKVKESLENCDFIFSQQDSSIKAINYAKEFNKKVVLYIHNDFKNMYDLEKFKSIINPSNILLIFNSKWLQESYNSDIKSIIIYPDINCNNYKTKTTKEFVTLINVSNLKGAHQLIEIAKRMPDINFLGVEGGYDEQIKNIDISNIKYIPNTKNMKKDVYSLTDILLMPSEYESWGRTATEALCSGIPVIATPTPGLKENLGDSGIFIDRDNIDEWVNMIRKLKDDRNYYNEVSEKCKIRSKEIMEKTKEQLNTLYNKLQEKESGGDKKYIYIKKINLMDNLNEYLLPILKVIYPGANIEFVDNRETYDLILKSDNLDSTRIIDTDKYIYVSCESYDTVKAGGVFEDPNCIAKILSTNDDRLKNEKNIYYLPYFLNIGPVKSNSTIFKREYTNRNRDKTAAYVARNTLEHRSNFFKTLKKLNDSVNSLGASNHTVNTEIPDRDKTYELAKIYSNYKFGFAMENKDEKGYITEKIMNVYRGGAIPIYWGTSDVKKIFNPDSYIYINDYPDFETCAKDIIAIANDDVRYNKMLDAPILLSGGERDYDKYYDTPPPKWVVDMGTSIKENITKKKKKNIKGGALNDISLNLDISKEELSNRMKKYNVIFGGVGRNIEPYIKTTLDNIDKCGNRFNKYEVIIYENDSSDNTRKILNDNKKDNYHYIFEDNITEPRRTFRLANGRQKVLDKAKELNKNNEYTFYIAVDLDDVNFSGRFVDTIETCFINEDWDILTGNQSDRYYDLWTIRRMGDMEYDCWRKIDDETEKGMDRLEADNKFLHSRYKKYEPGMLLEVDSAYGGIAIYRLKSLHNDCRYNGDYGDGREQCEHVPFTLCLKEKGLKIYINTSFLTN